MRIGGPRSPRLGRVVSPVILAALLAVLGAAPAIAAAATESQDEPAPKLNAATWLLLDPTDGEELAAHDPDRERAIASTTKLMTAYLALKKLRMGEKLEVPAYSAGAAESVAGLVEGERLTVHDLIVAMMLPSANDAAETVAEGISGSKRAFVALMNHTAADLGLDRTHYANPIGLDANGNYSTAGDLTDLASKLLSDRRFRKIVSKPEATLKSGAERRVVTNTNTLLLSDPSVDGVKTGHTLDAGYVLVASAKRDSVPLIAAVLGAPSEADRDADAEALLDYGYSLYEHRNAVRKGERAGTASVRYEDEDLPLLAKRAIAVSIRPDQDLRVDVGGPKQVEGPIAAGDRLGQVTVTLDGKFVGRTPLVAGRDVDEPTVVDRIGGPLVVALIVLALIVIIAAVAFALRRRHRASRDSERDPEERMRTRHERIRRRRGGDGE
jgi:D-alanyl-D-alanine carboxypeptidase (penicillin-binding protein 5/6)